MYIRVYYFILDNTFYECSYPKKSPADAQEGGFGITLIKIKWLIVERGNNGNIYTRKSHINIDKAGTAKLTK